MSMVGFASVLLLASAPVNSADTSLLETPLQNVAPAAPMASEEAAPPSVDPAVHAGPLTEVQAPDTAVKLAQPPVESVETAEPSAADEVAAPVQPVDQTQSPQEINEDENIITVTGRVRTPGDPLQNVNAESYAITQAIDEAVVAPSAHAYEKRVPEPLRNGLRNFANNLHEPAVFVNFLLQLKPGKAAETAGRFLVNSTVGVAGLFDIAKRKPINLPRRKNGFADTLGCYGVKPGPFLFLPIVGATTVRDLIGGGVDAFAIPIPSPAGRSLSKPVVAIPTSIARELDKRVEFDEELEIIHNSNDPYVAAREYYLQKRQAQIDGLCGKKKNDAVLP